MSHVAAISTLAIILFGLAGIAICRFVLARPNLDSPNWLTEVCSDRYRPMLRLLDGRDLEFMRSQPGVTPAMLSRLRHERCRIFRGYLHCLTADFRRVCWAVKILMLQSHQDRPDLAALLLRTQFSFGCAVCAMHVRVTLHAWGLGTVNISGLLRQFDFVRGQLCGMGPVTMASLS
jgi:hypothetical protein